jgi:hypothetical protein
MLENNILITGAFFRRIIRQHSLAHGDLNWSASGDTAPEDRKTILKFIKRRLHQIRKTLLAFTNAEGTRMCA